MSHPHGYTRVINFSSNEPFQGGTLEHMVPVSYQRNQCKDTSYWRTFNEGSAYPPLRPSRKVWISPVHDLCHCVLLKNLSEGPVERYAHVARWKISILGLQSSAFFRRCAGQKKCIVKRAGMTPFTVPRWCARVYKEPKHLTKKHKFQPICIPSSSSSVSVWQRDYVYY